MEKTQYVLIKIHYAFYYLFKSTALKNIKMIFVM